MKKNLIAVVTPVYNGEKSIEKSIHSLLAQTFTNWINIIINDGSIDKTKEILEKYQLDNRFIIIHFEKNQGRGFARQVALEKVLEINAKYMCMLDADDLYYPDKLEWQYDYMEKNPELTLMSCSLAYIDDEWNLKGVLEKYKEEKHFYFDDYRNYQSVPHACSIIKVSDIGNTTFDLKMFLVEDQDFLIRLLKDKSYSYMPKIGYLYNRESSFSFEKYKKSLLFGYYSIKKINNDKRFLLKYKLKNLVKIFLVRLVVIFGLQDKYFKKIGRPPFKDELSFHMSIIKSL